MERYTIIRDSREQSGWWFPETDKCAGTIVQKLDTGDYSIAGLESQVVIERKKNLAEFSQNIVQARFTREMERLAQIPNAFLLIDCGFADIINFPVGSGIPTYLQSKSRISPNFILSKIREYERKYGVYIVLAEGKGREIAHRILSAFAPR